MVAFVNFLINERWWWWWWSQIFPKVHTRTKRYCSFIQYGFNHYQHKIK